MSKAISKSLKKQYKEGKRISPFSKRKYGTGGKNPFLGKHHTEKTKEKLRKQFKGIKLSKEHRKKISKNSGVRGLNHWNWKGGITSLTFQIRHCYKYRQWRSDIFEKYNYICLKCGQKGGKLNVDHFPKSFSEIIKENNIKTFEQAMNCEELWNINNGRVLCEKCHKLTKNYLNYANKNY